MLLGSSSIGDDLPNVVDTRFNLLLEFASSVQFTASKLDPSAEFPNEDELHECLVQEAVSVDYVLEVRDLEPFAAVTEVFLDY